LEWEIVKLGNYLSHKPLVGHAAIKFEKSSESSEEKILIFGGWDGKIYSDDFYIFDTSISIQKL